MDGSIKVLIIAAAAPTLSVPMNPEFIWLQVITFERMFSRAMSNDCLGSSIVFLKRDWLEVIRVDAESITTEMVEV